MNNNSVAQIRNQVEGETDRAKAQLDILSKALSIVSSKDPMAYQAIQTMDGYNSVDGGTYDPSDDGEVERLIALGRQNPEGTKVYGEEELRYEDFDPEIFRDGPTPL